AAGPRPGTRIYLCRIAAAVRTAGSSGSGAGVMYAQRLDEARCGVHPAVEPVGDRLDPRGAAVDPNVPILLERLALDIPAPEPGEILDIGVGERPGGRTRSSRWSRPARCA